MLKSIAPVKFLILLVAYSSPLLVFFVIGNMYAVKRISHLKMSGANPHTKYSSNGIYPPSIKSFESVLHGDLCVRAGYPVLPNSVSRCPFSSGVRSAWFITDEKGFKTLGNHKDYDYLLVGDSFLSATGGDKMSEQLGAVLGKLSLNSFYEASHPGWGVDQYVHVIKSFDPPSKSVVLVIYEGNDLITVSGSESLASKPPSALKQFLQRYYSPVVNTYLNASSSIKSFVADTPLVQLMTLYFTGSRGVVDEGYQVASINGKPLAFFLPPSKLSNVDAKIPQSSMDHLQSISDKICLVVVVPSKHSAFLETTSSFDRHPSFALQMQSLMKKNVEVLDLASTFQNSIKYNPEIDYWWGDDTHWNAAGIDLAARAILDNTSCLL